MSESLVSDLKVRLFDLQEELGQYKAILSHVATELGAIEENGDINLEKLYDAVEDTLSTAG